MPPGEISVNCPGCGNQVRAPFAAVRRNNTYCSKCGKKIDLAGTRQEDITPTMAKAGPARRPYKSARGRR